MNIDDFFQRNDKGIFESDIRMVASVLKALI